MGEADIKYLKSKCNKLIEKALQMENEIQEKDLMIKQLAEQKSMIEQQTSLETVEAKEILPFENISDFINPDDNFEDKYKKILEMIKESNFKLQKKIEAHPDDKEKKRDVKKSYLKRVREQIAEGIRRIYRGAALVILMLLVSLAITVFVNAGLRNALIEFIFNSIR